MSLASHWPSTRYHQQYHGARARWLVLDHVYVCFSFDSCTAILLSPALERFTFMLTRRPCDTPVVTYQWRKTRAPQGRSRSGTHRCRSSITSIRAVQISRWYSYFNDICETSTQTCQWPTIEETLSMSNRILTRWPPGSLSTTRASWLRIKMGAAAALGQFDFDQGSGRFDAGWVTVFSLSSTVALYPE